MGCGCGSGKTYNTTSIAASQSRKMTTSNEDCTITLENLQDWLTKIYCFKDKGLYATVAFPKRRLNVYIGTLLSAQNYPNNICHFSKELDEVSNFMTVVNSLGVC